MSSQIRILSNTHDDCPHPKTIVRETDRIKQNHTDNSRVDGRQSRRVVRAGAEPGQHEPQTTQTRLQNAHNLLEVCRHGLLIRQAGASWTIARAGEIDPQRTEAHLGEVPDQADVQPEWTDSVQQTGAQEHEYRQLLRIASWHARYSQNPE
jgi:hypothetical protein